MPTDISNHRLYTSCPFASLKVNPSTSHRQSMAGSPIYVLGLVYLLLTVTGLQKQDM